MSDIERVRSALQRGSTVVIPTDTVYGIAVHPRVIGAVPALIAAKARPAHKPIPVLGADIDDLRSIAAFDDGAERVARALWPGPITLVLPRAASFHFDLGGDAVDTVAVRVPDHAMARDILRATGPLAVSSANRSGGPECHTVAEARAQLGDVVEVYVDGGECNGSASTVVSLVGGLTLIRAGDVTEREIAQILTS